MIDSRHVESIPIAAVRRVPIPFVVTALPFVVTVLPLAPLPLGPSPGSFPLELGLVRRPPRALVGVRRRLHIDRARLDVHGLRANIDGRRLHVDWTSRHADREVDVGVRLRSRGSTEHGGGEYGRGDESGRDGTVHDGSLSCDEVILRDLPERRLNGRDVVHAARRVMSTLAPPRSELDRVSSPSWLATKSLMTAKPTP